MVARSNHELINEYGVNIMTEPVKKPTVSNPVEVVVMLLCWVIKIPCFLAGVVVAPIAISVNYGLDLNDNKKFSEHCVEYAKAMVKLLAT